MFFCSFIFLSIITHIYFISCIWNIETSAVFFQLCSTLYYEYWLLFIGLVSWCIWWAKLLKNLWKCYWWLDLKCISSMKIYICSFGVLPTWVKFRILSFESHTGIVNDTWTHGRVISWLRIIKEALLSLPKQRHFQYRQIFPSSPLARQIFPIWVSGLQSPWFHNKIWIPTPTLPRSQFLSTVHTQSSKFKL